MGNSKELTLNQVRFKSKIKLTLKTKLTPLITQYIREILVILYSDHVYLNYIFLGKFLFHIQ